MLLGTPSPRARRWRVIATLLVGSLVTVVAACGADDGAASVPTVTADPTDTPDVDAFDFSNVVEIRGGAVAPAQTVAVVDREIVFRNATAVPQTVRATNGTFGEAGPAEATIEPGGEFSFRQTTPISITYEITTQPGVAGRIQVDPGTETI